MEAQPAVPAGHLNQELFDSAVRGYNKRQVNDHVERLQRRVRDLEDRLTRALDSEEQARNELVRTAGVPAPKPAHEEVSERLSQILKLAAEEAEQARVKAENEIAYKRQTSEQEMAVLVRDSKAEAETMVRDAREEAESLVQDAQDKATRLVTDAQDESETLVRDAQEKSSSLLRDAQERSESMLTDSRTKSETLVRDAQERSEMILSRSQDEAERTLSDAERDSQRMLDSSRSEADRLVSEATEHAERLRRQAEQRSNVVNGVLTERVAALDRAHVEASRRLGEIGHTIRGLLRAESEAGPLEPGILPSGTGRVTSGDWGFGFDGESGMTTFEGQAEVVRYSTGRPSSAEGNVDDDDIVIDLTGNEPIRTNRPRD
jgi:vacuolar-type H+-ATPase subunit H